MGGRTITRWFAGVALCLLSAFGSMIAVGLMRESDHFALGATVILLVVAVFTAAVIVNLRRRDESLLKVGLLCVVEVGVAFTVSAICAR